METAELSLRAWGGGEYRGQMGVDFSEWAERVGGSSALWEETGGRLLTLSSRVCVCVCVCVCVSACVCVCLSRGS